jgi:hypothetical protein
VLPYPIEKRTHCLAFLGDFPIAIRTCDGSIDPLEHAEPLEMAKPFKSSAITKDPPSTPSK